MNSNYRADTWVEEDVPTSDENNGLIQAKRSSANRCVSDCNKLKITKL